MLYLSVVISTNKSKRMQFKLRDYMIKSILSYITQMLPESIGHNFPTNVIPPEPKYCPMATSWKKIGIPQNTMATK